MEILIFIHHHCLIQATKIFDWGKINFTCMVKRQQTESPYIHFQVCESV